MSQEIKFRTQLFKETIKKFGFSSFGFAKAEFLQDEAKNLETWLRNGNHGSMSF